MYFRAEIKAILQTFSKVNKILRCNLICVRNKIKTKKLVHYETHSLEHVINENDTSIKYFFKKTVKHKHYPLMPKYDDLPHSPKG